MLHAGRYKPYVQSLQTAVIVHQFTKSHTNLSTRGAGEATVATGAEAGPTGMGDPPGAAGPDQGKTTGTVQPLCANTVGEPHTTQDKSAEPWEWNAIHATNLDIFHTCANKTWRMTRLRSST